ncbi:MAG: hypothetical protein ACREXK_07595, partial [Gammaproteobacteria bacterium]
TENPCVGGSIPSLATRNEVFPVRLAGMRPEILLVPASRAACHSAWRLPSISGLLADAGAEIGFEGFLEALQICEQHRGVDHGRTALTCCTSSE